MKPETILTLTTDWGTTDQYVAAVKGLLLQTCPELRVVDVSHNIAPFNMQDAAFVVGNAYPFFPKNSIHFIGVNFFTQPDAPMVVARADGHYFIWTKNDYLCFVAPHFEQVVQLAEQSTVHSVTLDVLPYVAINLLKDKDLQKLGSIVEIKNSLAKNPVIEQNSIVLHVLHIDHYGNAITNLTQEMFEAEHKNRKFTIFLGARKYAINCISTTYIDVQPGYPVAFFNRRHLLEIACVAGNASKIYKLNTESTILIKFEKT
ncbi:hypothetical protein FACS189456_0330 [Bacteroidia bacterium]|nr:hypothetical protein FACS189456_0330 [Bacteroidia bacterium]